MERIGMIRNKPVIGILPTYNLTNEENDPYQDRASFVLMYEKKILECGGIPIGLLNQNIEEYLPLCDGYLWPGGNKIWPEFYKVIEDAIANHKPLLGICLGMQAITTFFNVLEDKTTAEGKTFREVYEEGKKNNPYLTKVENIALHNHYVTKNEETIQAAKHLVQIKPNTLLASLYKEKELSVVSLHSIGVARVSKTLTVSATTKDHLPEAVEYTQNNSFIIGVQWHPEITNDNTLFHWLVTSSRKENNHARNC